MGSGFGTLCGRKKSESPAPERSDPPIGMPPIAWVGHGEIARREDSQNLADLRPPRLSLGPHARAHARISSDSPRRPNPWRLRCGAEGCHTRAKRGEKVSYIFANSG